MNGQRGPLAWRRLQMKDLRSSSHLSPLALESSDSLLSPFGSHLERLGLCGRQQVSWSAGADNVASIKLAIA